MLKPARNYVLSFLTFVIVLCGAHPEARSDAAFFKGQADTLLPNRMAMVVGIPYYQSPWNPLENVTRDLPEIQRILSEMGFEQNKLMRVDSSNVQNGWVTRAHFYQKLYSFMEDARQNPQSILVFYFAGHGFTHNGNMYLVPADAPIRYSEDPDRFAIRLADVVSLLNAAKPLAALVIVDACRDLPFSRLTSLASLAESEVESGVSDFKYVSNDAENDSPSVGIFYSATKREKALDGPTDQTSHFVTAFTGALRDSMKKGGPIYVQEIIDETTARVRALTGQRQNPRGDTAFGVKLPLFSTKEAFEQEDKAWKHLQKQIQLETVKIDDYSIDKANELIYCRLFGFRREYGYSYYWRKATTNLKNFYSIDAAKKCLEQSKAASSLLFAPTKSVVVEPSGAIDVAKVVRPISADASPAVQSTPHGNVSAPQSPAELPGKPASQSSTPELRVIQEALSSGQRKVVVSEATQFDQPDYPGKPRTVPLQGGETVLFLNFVDAERNRARVYHEKHGIGLVPTAALAAVDSVIRLALRFNGDDVTLSPAQRATLEKNFGEVRIVKSVAAVLTYPQREGSLGFLRAQAIAEYIGKTPSLPSKSLSLLVPSISPDTDLNPGLVTVSLVVETAPAPKSDVATIKPEVTKVQANELLLGGPNSEIRKAIGVRVIAPGIKW